MKKQDLKKIKLPENPGVYFFKKGKQILYIGKATFLNDRVKSYFSKDPKGKNTSYEAGLIATRGLAIFNMVQDADHIDFQVTDSVLEALILEANLIKKYQPKYNTKEKDDKSFNYVCITRDKIPLVLVIRGRKIFSKQSANSSRFTPKGPYVTQNSQIIKKKYSSVFGPFPNGLQLRDAMKIIRRIFPFIDDQSSKKNNKIFYEQLGLVPEIASQKHQNFNSFTPKGPYADKNFDVSVSQSYKNNLKNLKLFFQGKKKSVVLNLKKEMMDFAKKHQFEKANEIKKRIFSLEHINDVALIKDENIKQENFERSFLAKNERGKSLQNFRIEAYDIAHMSGKNMVGVMTVIENNEVAKHEYKKFIIRTQTGANDTGALEEVLSRRFRHTEWGLPSLVVVDGSTAQINIAKRVLDRYKFNIPIVAVVKDDKHKVKAIIGDELIIKKYKKSILLSNSEAHRFAIAFHKQKRNKNFLEN